MTIAFLILGLVLLVAGGEFLVRGGVALALALGLSPLMIGLTLIGFGTSTPELTTSVQAALMGSPGVAVGNVVGSNICNILLILGLAALLRPVHVAARGFRRDGPALVLATVLCIAALLWGELGRMVGAVFVALLLGYVALAYVLERDSAAEPELTVPPATRLGMAMALGQAVLGIVLVIAGADFLVDSAVVLARDLGVSDAVIGLTVVAVGTSLPELATSVAAALRGRSDIAFGAVVGSNIYNILGILGVTALVTPLQIPDRIMAVDGWVMLAATAALVLTTMTGWRINRMEGGLMLGAYAGYVGWMAASA